MYNYCRVSTINVDFLQPGCRSAASGREPWLSSPGVSDADPDTLLLFGLVSKVPRTYSSLLLALGIFLLSSSVASSGLQPVS